MSVCTATHRAIKSAHTHTQPLTPPPPGLIHLLHLRMRALWCHLQSHYFKSTKAPHCHQYKEQTHPLTSSFVPMSPNSNSPAESPYTVKGELQSVLYNQVFLSFCPLAPITCTTITMTSFLYPSSILLTWKKLPWRMNLCALKMRLVCVWVNLCVIVYTHLSERWLCGENPMITVLPVDCTPRSPHWKYSQAGNDVMRQGDNTTTTLVHG